MTLQFNGTNVQGVQFNGTNVQGVQVKGKVGYTKVGSPTVTDGVASGFSASNYLQMTSKVSQTLYEKCLNSLEILAKINVTTAINDTQQIIYFPTGGTYAGLYVRNGGKIAWQLYNTDFRIVSENVLTSTTDYWIKAIIANKTASLHLSTDGNTWTQLGSDLDISQMPGRSGNKR